MSNFIGRLVVAVIWDVLDPLFQLADRTVCRISNLTNEDPEYRQEWKP